MVCLHHLHLCHGLCQCGHPSFSAADLPPLLASSTSTAFLYDSPLRPASTACLYSLPLHIRPASTSMVCLHHTVIIVIVIVHFLFKRNLYLSLLFVIYIFFLLHFLKLFPISSSKYAVEVCDLYLLLTQSLPCYYCLTVFVLFLPMGAVPSILLPSIFCLDYQISEPNIFQLNCLGLGGGVGVILCLS
jgi:hypothetical protein